MSPNRNPALAGYDRFVIEALKGSVIKNESMITDIHSSKKFIDPFCVRSVIEMSGAHSDVNFPRIEMTIKMRHLLSL